MSYQSDPARKAVAITPNDSTEIPVTRAIYIGGSGDLVVRLEGDSANVTFYGVTAGSILPLKAKLVAATSTTASNMLGLY